MGVPRALVVAVSLCAAAACSVDDDLKCDLAGGLVQCGGGLVCDVGSGKCIAGGTCGSCTAFPASTCTTDGKAVKSYHDAGACRGGACVYAPTVTACAHGCANGTCQGCTPTCMGRECGDDGCGGACGTGACATPPPARCTDATTRQTYGASGTCSSAGRCVYSPTQIACAHGCANGTCQGCTPTCVGRECGDDGCGGACGTGACATPPPASCADATTRRTYGASGTCSFAGSCTYSSTDIVCPAVANGQVACAAGTCGFTCNTGFTPLAGGCAKAGATGSGSPSDWSTGSGTATYAGLAWDTQYGPGGAAQGGHYTWSEAGSYCVGKSARLPTKDEAVALGTEAGAANTAGNWTVFAAAFNAPFSTWTSTTDGAPSGSAWDVGVHWDGAGTNPIAVGGFSSARCVR